MVARVLAPPTPRTLSRAEYHAMGELGFFRAERVELVRGIVVRMSPIGPGHACAVQRLTELLLPRLLGRATVRTQQPFVAADESEPEPDIAVVPLGRYADRHPSTALLVIEVAESSLDYDRETKGPLYAGSNVDEYWVVDVAARCVEIYGEPASGRSTRTRRAAAGETLSPRAFPDATVAVSELFS
jgi:Uma2 family endonuclease